MYGSAWSVSTIFGVALVFSGTPVAQSVVVSSVLILAILVAWTFVYCLVPHPVRQPEPMFLGRRIVVACGALAISVAAGLSTGTIEAAVVNRRLRKYAEENRESDLEAVARVLEFARSNAIPVAPSAVAAVGSNLQRLTTKKDESPEVVGLAHRAAESAASLQSELLRQPANAKLQPVANLPVYSVFDRCYIHGIRFELDTRAFLDSYIEDCTIRYGGGPVFLKNTVFVRCNFEFSGSPEARELLLLFTQRNDPNFSYRANEIFRSF
jgi:hypothetical protein